MAYSVVSFVISKWLLPELSIPAPVQKDRRLWGREWLVSCHAFVHCQIPVTVLIIYITHITQVTLKEIQNTWNFSSCSLNLELEYTGSLVCCFPLRSNLQISMRSSPLRHLWTISDNAKVSLPWQISFTMTWKQWFLLNISLSKLHTTKGQRNIQQTEREELNKCK